MTNIWAGKRAEKKKKKCQQMKANALQNLMPFFSGQSLAKCGRKFWDVVLITTADKPQKEAFELQVEEKRNRAELPTDLPIHIVSDPPGVRIGKQ